MSRSWYSTWLTQLRLCRSGSYTTTLALLRSCCAGRIAWGSLNYACVAWGRILLRLCRLGSYNTTLVSHWSRIKGCRSTTLVSHRGRIIRGSLNYACVAKGSYNTRLAQLRLCSLGSYGHPGLEPRSHSGDQKAKSMATLQDLLDYLHKFYSTFFCRSKFSWTLPTFLFTVWFSF